METLKQMDRLQFAGFSSVSRLLERYKVTDRARFDRTQALIESGRLNRALDEHDEMLAEDMVTGDLPILLAGNADLHFREGAASVVEPWRAVWNTESYTTFREQTVADLNEVITSDDEEGNAAVSGTLPVVPEHHGFNDATVGEHYETMQLLTYGCTFSLTRQMLIDDNQRSLTGIPARMGRTAIRTRNIAAQTYLELNPLLSDGVALFDAATHGNFVAGGTALNMVNLKAQFTAFSAQEWPDGLTTNIDPTFLIVPSDLALDADELVNDLATRLITADTDDATTTFVTDRNVMAGRLQVVVFPELTDADDWYLAADPNMIGTVEVGFLRGQESPELFTQAPNVDLSAADGTRFKVRTDFDTYAVNWAGLRKITGA